MTFYEWKETLANDTSLFSLEEQAWDYQQKRIDELKKDNSKLAEVVIIPEGYVLVPVEPTDDMLNEAFNIASVSSSAARAIYKAMLKAAQEEE